VDALPHAKTQSRTPTPPLPSCSPALPPHPSYTLKVRLYRPRSASLLQGFLSWLTGMPAEFADPRFPAYSAGREGEAGAARAHGAARGCCMPTGRLQTARLTPLPSPGSQPLAASTVTRVVSNGSVNVSVSILTKDLAAFGYADGSGSNQGASRVVHL
jgi:B9 domain-containing protein 1